MGGSLPEVVPFSAYPFTVIGLFIYRLVQMLIYALVGMIFANIVKANLEYVTLVRLAAVSITPVIILNAVRRMLDISVPYIGLLSFLIAMGYLFFAVKASAEQEADRRCKKQTGQQKALSAVVRAHGGYNCPDNPV